MIVRPSLVRSIPFWILLAGSVAVTVTGAMIVAGTLPQMVAGLEDQTATTGQVYGGQSWIVVGAGLLTAGIVGVFAVLALAAARSFLAVSPTAPATETDVVDAEPAEDDVRIGGEPAPAEETADSSDEVVAAR